ncbi:MULTISPECIES: hypothetical protein [Rhodobacter]|uniref:hypothetical protein n=1 Tax=Rhodobacter TaxID=1060 RepID=UPI0009FC9BC7|nr:MULTISPECIES: hypothetical protein [Rhodobacter]
MPIRCRSKIALLGLAVLLAACKPGADDPPPLPPVGAAAVARDKGLCEAGGGQWASLGGAQYCVTRTKDAGRSCRASTDCEGACLARSMTCAPAKPLLGCNEVLSSTGLRGTECIE